MNFEEMPHNPPGAEKLGGGHFGEVIDVGGGIVEKLLHKTDEGSPFPFFAIDFNQDPDKVLKDLVELQNVSTDIFPEDGRSFILMVHAEMKVAWQIGNEVAMRTGRYGFYGLLPELRGIHCAPNGEHQTILFSEIKDDPKKVEKVMKKVYSTNNIEDVGIFFEKAEGLEGAEHPLLTVEEKFGEIGVLEMSWLYVKHLKKMERKGLLSSDIKPRHVVFWLESDEQWQLRILDMGILDSWGKDLGKDLPTHVAVVRPYKEKIRLLHDAVLNTDEGDERNNMLNSLNALKTLVLDENYKKYHTPHAEVRDFVELFMIPISSSWIGSEGDYNKAFDLLSESGVSKNIVEFWKNVEKGLKRGVDPRLMLGYMEGFLEKKIMEKEGVYKKLTPKWRNIIMYDIEGNKKLDLNKSALARDKIRFLWQVEGGEISSVRAAEVREFLDSEEVLGLDKLEKMKVEMELQRVVRKMLRARIFNQLEKPLVEGGKISDGHSVGYLYKYFLNRNMIGIVDRDHLKMRIERCGVSVD